MQTKAQLVDQLQVKLKHLFETAWDGRINLNDVETWLQQFDAAVNLEDDEQLHALFLLSNFIYFGQFEIRELLRSLYRDLYRTPVIHSIRRNNGDTLDPRIIFPAFQAILDNTRFLGVGNPSESGAHLLYFFRQENDLSKDQFINTHEIFQREATASGLVNRVRDVNVEHYVFIDDICGSGTQAEQYSRDLVEPLKSEISSAKVSYYVLFATSAGLKAIRDLNRFDNVAAVFELDNSFKSLEPQSRLFVPEIDPYKREKVRRTCEKYGSQIWRNHPRGYKDGQLLIGFPHNTPDNTLPIFWGTRRTGGGWTPLFKRYTKE